MSENIQNGKVKKWGNEEDFWKMTGDGWGSEGESSWNGCLHKGKGRNQKTDPGI